MHRLSWLLDLHMRALHKIAALRDDDTHQAVRWPRVFSREETTGPIRFAVASTEQSVNLLADLATCLNPKLFLLYVLTVPRNTQRAGRYESPSLQVAEVRVFLDKFSTALECDGRHHLWIGSTDGQGTLVYDHHNIIYAYGPLASFEDVLKRRGFMEGSFSIPVPHVHSFHGELDGEVERLLTYFDWRHFELEPGDDY